MEDVKNRRKLLRSIANVTKAQSLSGELRLPQALADIEDPSKFIAQVKTAVKEHHPHSSLYVVPPPPVASSSSTKPLSLRKPPVYQRKPDLHWDAEALVGRIVFYTYVMLPGEHNDPRPDKIVVRCRRALDRWTALGMRGLVVDLTNHRGGSFRPALHAIGLHVLKGCFLFDWLEAAGGQRLTYDGEAIHAVDFKNEPGSPDGISGGLRRLSTSARVAVVVSDRTSSAGEITAAMLQGKAGVRTFGSSASTAGALSVNQVSEVAQGIVLVLTTHLVRTSDGKLHSDELLHPDEVSKSPVEAAVRWASGRRRPTTA